MRPFLLAGLLLAAASVAGAVTKEEAQAGFETAVRAYVASKGHGDYLAAHMHGKALRLTVDHIELQTVHRSGGKWGAVVDFVDAKTKKVFWADVTAAFANDVGDVKEFRWLSKRELGDARIAALEDGDAAKAPRTPGPAGILPDLSLPTVDGNETSLSDCDKAKCLTVVVAPWCPHCRKTTGVLVALQDWLPAHDVGMRVVVAADSEEKVNDYAQSFGPHTMVDPDSKLRVPGFPCFIVSTKGGGILKQQGGAPEDEKDPAQFASAIGLP